MATDNNHINNLGPFASLNAVWAAHPEGGRDGDYITINNVEYYWSDRYGQWVTSSGGTPSGTLDDITTAIAALREAVAALRDSSFAVGVDGRLDSTKAPWVVLTFMGESLDDGDSSTSASVGDIAYRESDKKIVCVTASNGIQILGDPIPGLVYCNAKTGKLYRWRYVQGEWCWHRVGNDVTDALAPTNKRDSALSAYQGYLLSASIADLTSSLTTLLSRVDNSIIGDKASSRVVIDVMDYTPPASGGQSITVLPGGGYSTEGYTPIQAPSGMVGDDMLCYAPGTTSSPIKKLYYFYKVNNGGAVETRCSIIDPDPRLVYWDASGTHERAMRWNASSGEWIYNIYYAVAEAVTTALAAKADADEVYTKEEIDTAFSAAASGADINDAFRRAQGALSNEDTQTNGGDQQQGGGE